MTSASADDLAYPADWEDEDRMHFLLGSFPPTAASSSLSLEEQKVQFWSSLIRSVSRATRRPVFSVREIAERLSFHPVAPCYDKLLLGRLQWRGQTPSCLKQVLDVMRQRRQLCLVQDLLESAKEQGWLSWGAGIVSSPVRWVWRKYQPSMDFMDIVYVDTQLLKDAADSVLHQLQSVVEFRNTDQVVSGDKFKSVSLEVVESSAVEAVELELVRQGKVRCRTFNGQKIIKFCMSGDHLPVDVTDMDLHIVSIKETIAALQVHTSSLATRTARMKKEARNHLQQKQRELALSYLQRGRGAQQKLVSKAAMLANVEGILHQIQMAETNALVLEAYQIGREVLKTINDDMLTAAEEVVDELHEVIQESEEVGAILGGSVENEELEKELEALLSGPDSSTQADDLAEQLSKLELVSPPDADPVKTTHIMAQKKTPAVTPLH